MKLLKKIAAVSMTAVMAFSFTACGDRAANMKNLKIEQVTNINVWYDNEEYKPYIEYVTEQMTKANEMVKVNPVYVDENNYLDNIYQGSVHNNNIADVYLLSSEYLQKAYLMGLVTANDTYSSTYTSKKYGNSAIKAATYKDTLYGYPVSFNTGVMVYNKKFASAVNTFTELTDYCNSYKVNEDNKNVQIVATWDVSDMLTNYAFAAPYITAGGVSGEDNTIVTINQSRLKEAMTEFAKLDEAYCIDRSSVDEDFCVDMFKQGKLLYTILESDRLKELDESNIEYGVCQIPSLTSNLESNSLSETTLAIVNPYTSSVDAAKVVAQAISYDYADKFYEYTGHISARNDVKYSKNAADYKELLSIYSNSAVKADYVGSDGIYLKYEIMIHQIWDGTSVDEAFNTFVNKK